jgi:hypothetical protein
MKAALSEEIMKTTRFNSILSSSLIVCALTIGSLASTRSAFAQESTALLRVDIPFAFQMAKQTLPAGVYQIDRRANDIIVLHGPDKASRFLMMHQATTLHPADHAAVVFERYGSKYFLHQVWTGGTTHGLESPKSRAESNALKAQNNQAPTSVELAFNTAPRK